MSLLVTGSQNPRLVRVQWLIPSESEYCHPCLVLTCRQWGWRQTTHTCSTGTETTRTIRTHTKWPLTLLLWAVCLQMGQTYTLTFIKTSFSRVFVYKRWLSFSSFAQTFTISYEGCLFLLLGPLGDQSSNPLLSYVLRHPPSVSLGCVWSCAKSPDYPRSEVLPSRGSTPCPTGVETPRPYNDPGRSPTDGGRPNSCP